MGVKRTTIFAPNLTGPLHLGTAAVLWFTALEAERRGLELIMRLDDRYEVSSRLDKAVELVSIRSIDQAFRLLAIPAPKVVFRFTEREGRYCGVAGELVRAGLADIECHEPLTVVMPETLYATDAVHGRIREFCSPLILNGRAYSTMTVVDRWDYEAVFHVRGYDLLQPDRFAEMKAHMLLEKLWPQRPMPEREYAHIPIICDAVGTPLSKSAGVPREYEFGMWARQWRSPEKRRAAIERMLAADPALPLTTDNTSRAAFIHVAPDGKRIQQVFPFERGMHAEKFYAHVPDRIAG